MSVTNQKVLVMYEGDTLCIDRDMFYQHLTDLPLFYLRPHLGDFIVCEVYRYERLIMMLEVIMKSQISLAELKESSVYDVYENLRPGTPNRT